MTTKVNKVLGLHAPHVSPIFNILFATAQALIHSLDDIVCTFVSLICRVSVIVTHGGFKCESIGEKSECYELQLTPEEMGCDRSAQETMTYPARAPQQLVQRHEEQRVVDRKWEGQVSHVTRTVDIVQRACPAQVVFVTWTEGGVVEPSDVGVKEAVKRVGICDLFTAHLLYLFARVCEKPDGGETPWWRKARVQTTNINHDWQSRSTNYEAVVFKAKSWTLNSCRQHWVELWFNNHHRHTHNTRFLQFCLSILMASLLPRPSYEVFTQTLLRKFFVGGSGYELYYSYQLYIAKII